jgi:hypothetical protein
MPEPTNITRKSISFPEDLAAALSAKSAAERRSFSSQVVKILEDFFYPQASDASTGGER